MLLVALLAAAAAATAPPVPTAAPAGTSASTASAPSSGTYVGQSSDHQLVRVKVRRGRVVRVDARAWRFVCAPEGNVGPFLVTVGPNAPIVAGRFAFAVGPAQSRLRMRGTFGPRHTLNGAFRVWGTIGTGDPCVSPTRAFTAARR